MHMYNLCFTIFIYFYVVNVDSIYQKFAGSLSKEKNGCLNVSKFMAIFLFICSFSPASIIIVIN